MKRSLLVLLIGLVPAVALAQTNPAAQAARQWRQQHERAIVDEFFTLLSIPNIARDRDNIQRNAEAIAKMLEKRGVAAKLISVPGGNPIVFGEIRTPGATRTIVFYAHYQTRQQSILFGARGIIPIGNHDNNQHSFDENLRIQNLWDGIELMAALLTM